MDIENKTDKVKAAVSEQSKARDALSNGLANLKAKKVQLDEEISSNVEKRSKMVLTRAEHTRTGGSDEGLNALIFKSQAQEATDKEELAAIEKTIPVDEGKLKMAEAALKRATFLAIQTLRPDTEVDALFVAAMDAVDAWQVTYKGILRDLGVLSQISIYDGEWQLSLDPHLKNSTVKRLNIFVPEIEQPEPTPTDDIPDEPTVQPAKPEPKVYTDAEILADARKNGREKTMRDQHGQTEAIIEHSL